VGAVNDTCGMYLSLGQLYELTIPIIRLTYMCAMIGILHIINGTVSDRVKKYL
jgi:hypothetical protein